jgi:yeast amino acid transporter
VVIFNFFNVRRYGEIEFWMTAIKVTVIVGIIVLGVVLPMNGSTVTRLLGTDPHHNLIVCNDPATDNCVEPPGFNCKISLKSPLIIPDWRENPFKEFLVSGTLGRLAGFWVCCCNSVYAFTGSDVIGVTANEAERPRETMPIAIRRIAWRLIIYYIGAAFVLSVNLSSNDPQLMWFTSNPKGSYQGPFVLMMQRTGIRGLDHIVNGVVLIAALSVANSNLYSAVLFHDDNCNI